MTKSEDQRRIEKVERVVDRVKLEQSQEERRQERSIDLQLAEARGRLLAYLASRAGEEGVPEWGEDDFEQVGEVIPGQVGRQGDLLAVWYRIGYGDVSTKREFDITATEEEPAVNPIGHGWAVRAWRKDFDLEESYRTLAQALAVAHSFYLWGLEMDEAEADKPGRVVRMLRAYIGCNQAELGQEIGASAHIISRLENGQGSPDLAFMVALAKRSKLPLLGIMILFAQAVGHGPGPNDPPYAQEAVKELTAWLGARMS